MWVTPHDELILHVAQGREHLEELKAKNWILFDSKKEANRFIILKWMLKSGDINGLELQPRFPIHIANIKICDYVADFKYGSGGRMVVEDCKGMLTDVYKLKKKMFLASYPQYNFIES